MAQFSEGVSAIAQVQGTHGPNFSDFIGFANWDQWYEDSDSAVLVRQIKPKEKRIECSRNLSIEVEFGLDLDFASCLNYTWRGVNSKVDKFNYICVHDLEGFDFNKN